MEEKSIVEQLREHLANTPKEILDKEWKEVCEATKDIESPTVEEYLRGYSVWHKPEEVPVMGFYFGMTEGDFPCIAFSNEETIDVLVAACGIKPKLAKWMYIPE